MGTANKNYFGEAIPFSRADMAGINDFGSLCRCDLEKTVTKAKIWKMPASQSFIKKDCNGDAALAFWKKSIRDAVSPKPSLWGFSHDHDLKSYEIYAEEVAYLRDLVAGTQSVGLFIVDDQAVNAEKFITDRYFQTGGRLYSLNLKGRTIFLDRDIMRIAGWTPEMAASKCKRKGYGETKEEKAIKKVLESIHAAEYSGQINPASHKDLEAWWRKTKNFTYLEVMPKGSRYRYEYPESIIPDRTEFEKHAFFVTDSSKPGKPEFYFVDTKEEAEALRLSLAKAYVDVKTQGTEKIKKKRFSYVLDKVIQTGGMSAYPLVRDIIPDEIRSEFKFRGGEFGNWMSEKDIQGSLNASYVSFGNLAMILGITPESISFNGKMGIAYGSRGHGKAAAHYEHGTTDVINLTKMSGAGCLAHEWGHALDRHIADALGMTEGTLASTKSFTPWLPKELTDVYKLFGRGTRCRRDSIKYGSVYQKAGGYWDSEEELFARAFDCYVLDKLNKAGIKDTYLTAYAEQYKSKDSYGNDVFAYPIGEEREEFEKAFDTLFEWAKTNGVVEKNN